MTEAILNNILQVTKNDFSPSQREKAPNKSGRSFAETMQEINQQRQRTQKKSNQSSKAIKEQTSSLDDQEFLKKLKKILAKNNKEVPSELLSLLQSGSLSKEQELMLGQLMLNLKNNNLDISELKSLLERNNDLSADSSENAGNSELADLFAKTETDQELKLQSLNADDLEKIASMLETGELKLSEEDNLKLKNEIEQLAEVLKLELNQKPELNQKETAQKLEQIMETEKLDNKLAELISLFKESDFKAQDLAALPEQEEVKTPLLAQLLNSDNSDFAELTQTLSSGNGDSLFAELAAQMKEILAEENSKMTSQQTETKVNLNNSELLSFNSDSALDFALAGSELESKNQNNFFDLDNSNLFFNFEQENQNTANNLNQMNFNLNTENIANSAENTDLRAQVVEQFRGEYSPETKEMQIQLKPESLGKIDISLSYDNEQLTGKMLVESELVRAQLENSLKGLKSDLMKQGINIEQFKIETAKTAPQQVEKQDEFAFNDQNAAFSDGETGENQEYEQRQFFQGQYYVHRNNGSSNLNSENVMMRQQEIINRAAFSNEKINLLA